MSTHVTLVAQGGGLYTVTVDDDDRKLVISDAEVTGALSSPPPPPPVDVPPVDVPPPPPVDVPPPPPPTGGSHIVIVSSTDPTTGITWYAQATVGEDWTVDGQWIPLTSGSTTHTGIAAKIYSDCVDVGADRGDNAYEYLGWSLSVTYDGAVVFEQASVNFYRGTLNKTIRYGPQAPWHPVDLSLFPNWANGSPTLPDLSRGDFSYNGKGSAFYPNMDATGDRGDLGFVPADDVPFCVEPSDATFAPVRKVADNSGAWAICYRNQNTGQPYEVTDYPNASFIQKGDRTPFAGNPIVTQLGVNSCPLVWDQAHQTGYDFVASAATGTARDRDHVAIQANAAIIGLSPGYYQANGMFQNRQIRGTAWGMRSIFLGIYLGPVSMRSYFEGQLAFNLTKAEAQPKNAYGLLQETWTATGFYGPYTATGTQQGQLLRFVMGVVSYKRPEWRPYAAYLASWLPIVLCRLPTSNANNYPANTIYTTSFLDASKNFLPDYSTILWASLQSNQKWSAADATAYITPGISMDAAYALQVKYGFANKKGDMFQYVGAAGGWPAQQRAAVAANVHLGVPYVDACWALMESLPTKPNFSTDWRWNIVPRNA